MTKFYDPYRNDSPGMESPASNLYRITPDDDSDLSTGVKSLRIFNPTAGTATLRMTTIVGDEVTISIPSGGLLVEPVRVQKVHMTGTTAGLEIHGYTDEKIV